MSRTLTLKKGDEPNPIDKTGLCLLSLDGGGVRGLSTLYILRGLMQRLNHERQKERLPTVKPCDVFDLIGGTSTGGLIAIMLGRLEMTVEACIAAYTELMKSVFETKSSWLPIGLLGKTKAQFDSNKLRKAIEEVVTNNGASAGDLFDDGRERGCRVFVCTTAHETAGITRLRSYSLPHKQNVSATICEAALATSAATGFFDPVYIGTRKFEDGALGANNPAEEVEEEAADIWCSDSREMMPLVKCFVSIGTGNPGKKAIEDNMLKFLSRTLVNLVTQTETTERRVTARWARLLDEKRYYRLNVEQGLQDVGLAEYKEDGKISAATSEYLDHAQQNSRVRDCVVNLRGKQNFTNTVFEAVVKEYTVRIVQLQSKSHVFNNLPFPQNPRFVGRNRQLEQLQREISNSRNGKKIAITGLGGIGKTQIALEIAYRVRTETPECSIYWIPAISREGLEQTYADIVQELRIPGREERGADSKVLLQRYLSQKNAGRWLLIFDNADDIEMWIGKGGLQEDLVEFLPRSDEGCILFTTRNRKAAVKLADQNVIFVGEADQEMTKLLLRGYLVRKELMDDSQEAVELCKELAFLPLAIVQAAAYINENGTTLKQFLGLLAEQEVDVIKLLSEDFEDEGRYRGRGMKNPVAVTWLISFRQIRALNPLAADYLSFMACVEPTDIPQSMLPPGESRTQEMVAIGLLMAYSFLSETSAKMTLDMHRLVHLATRSWLRQENQLAGCMIGARQQLTKVLPSHDYSSRSIWRLYLPHARRMLGCKLPSGDEDDGHIQLLCKFASCLYEEGKYNEAACEFIKIVETRKRVLGEEDPDTLTSMNDLALTYKDQGRWKQAEELEVQVMETRQRVLGEEHLDTLTSMNNLASTYRNQGRWKQAEELEVQVMETRQRVLGEEHLDTLTSMNNLASTYRKQGRWKQAEELELQVIETRTRELGETHPAVLTSMSDLASTYREQGRWNEAAELEVQVMETRKRELGDEHPVMLNSMNNLASTYRNQGRWKEAVELEVRAMTTRKRVLGEEHPDTISSINNLAVTYRKQGRSNEAEELQVQVTETFKRVLGTEHPSTLSSMGNLALTYRDQGRWKKAEELQIEVLDIYLRVIGEEHPDTLSSMGDLASTFWFQGRWKEAEDLGVRVMETEKRVVGEEHPSTLARMHHLALTYENQGRLREAEELKIRVMETSKKVFGNEHPSTLASMTSLALTFWNQGRLQEAEELEVQVMETRKRVLGNEHPDTLTSMNNLAHYMWTGRDLNEKAIKLMDECVQLKTHVLGPDHPETLSSANTLNTWKLDI